MVPQPTFAWQVTAGPGSVDATGLYTAGTTTGTAVVRAAAAGVSGTATVTVANAAPTVAVTATATLLPGGTTAALTVLGADDGGEPNLTYTWTATSAPAGPTPTFAANGTNAGKATTVTFAGAGTYTFAVTISDGSLTTTSSAAVTVTQLPTTLAVTPPVAALNLNGSMAFAAVVRDQFGTPLSTQPAVAWAKAAGVGAVSAAGLYTAPATPGVASVTATAAGLTAAAAVTVTNAAPTVATPAAAGSPTVTGTGTTLSVLGADDGGEPNLTYTWTATAAPPGGLAAFAANGTNAARNTAVTFTRAGTYTLAATISDGLLVTTSGVAVTVVQSVTTVAVAGSSPSVPENGTAPFAAVAADQFGLPMSPQPTFAWAVAAGPGSVGPTGLYTASATTGTATVTATAGGVGGSATVTVVNAPPTIAVPAAATPGLVTGTTAALSVFGADDGGEPNLTYTWAVALAPAGASPTFARNGTNAAKSTTVTFDHAGAYAFTATISDGTNSTASTAAVTVAQTPAGLAVSPPVTSVAENAPQPFTAAASDQFGRPMAVPPAVAWSSAGVGSVDAAGLFTSAGTPGAAVVTATAAGLTGTATVTVTNSPPTIAVPAIAVTAGTTAALSVLGADDGGESNLTYTWAVAAAPAGATPTFDRNGTNTAKLATVTFDRAGAYTLLATVSDGTHAVTSAVTTTVVQTVTAVAVAPSSAAVPENATRLFTAVATDQFGRPLVVPPAFTWTSAGVGSIDAVGLFTSAATPGTATVTATAGGVSGTATVTVVNAPPTVVVPAAAVPAGTTAALSVLGADDGGEPNLTYTWAVTSAPAGASTTFDRNGTNAAKLATVTFDRAGTYALAVTISDGANTVTSTTTATAAQAVGSVVVSPGTVTTTENGTQLFAAAVTDQFGRPMVVPPVVTWSDAGVGAVTAVGLFTAGGTPGPAAVTATAGGVAGSAAVTVVNAPPTVAVPATATPVGTTVVLSALGTDDGGEPNLTYTWAVTSAPTGASPTFAANGTHAARSTVATVDAAGAYAFAVTISDGTSAVTSAVAVAVAQTLAGLTVTPGTAALDLNGTQPFAAAGVDQFGRPMSTAVAWTVLGTGTITAAGLFTAGPLPGTSTVVATAAGFAGQATVAVTNAAPTIAAAAADGSVTETTAALSVLGADDGGEPDLTYAWSVVAGPAGASPTFPLNGTRAARALVATFDAAGSYTLRATVRDAFGATATSDVAVTIGQALSAVAVTPPVAVLAAGDTRAFAATALDQFGDPMPGAATWSVVGGGTIDAAGLYTAPATAATPVVAATIAGRTATAAVTVVSVPTVAAAVSAAGTTAALSVVGAAASGLTFTWSLANGPAAVAFSSNGSASARGVTATFAAPGTYDLHVSVDDGVDLPTLLDLPVTVAPALTTVTVTPATATVPTADSQPFVAVGTDQFGLPMVPQPTFAWTVASGGGSVDPAGNYTAPPTAGPATVRAAGGSVSGTATVSVVTVGPVVTTPALASPALVTGTTTTLSVAATDAVPTTYTWAATSAPAGASPTFSANDTAAAAQTVVAFERAGTYTFAVAVDDGSRTATSTVAVAVVATATGLTVTPPAAALDENGTATFAAVVTDQFGRPMAAQPPVVWTLAAGVGAVVPTGLFVAGTTPGTATVRASTAGGPTATATVTVTNAAPTVAVPAAATLLGTTAALSVLGADDGGEPNLTYTWAATAAPAGAHPLFATNGINLSKLTTVTLDEAGTYTFGVTIDDGSRSVDGSVDVVVAQTPTGLAVTPAAAAMVENATEPFAATETDQFGDPMSPQPAVAWTSAGVGSISPAGLFASGPAAGGAVVTAAADGLLGTAAVVVTNAPPTLPVPPVATPAVVTGTTTTLTASAADDGGEAGLTYTWAATTGPAGAAPAFSADGTNAAKSTAVTFDRPGTYTFAVTADDGHASATASVTVVVVPTIAGIGVTPSSFTVDENGTRQLTAAAVDQFGTPLLTQPSFAWTVLGGVGTVDPTGLFTAGTTPGVATLRAAAGGLLGTVAVTVANAAPTLATAPAATLDPAGTAAALSVLGADDGGEPGLTYTWAAVAAPTAASPAFSANGTNAAKAAVVTFDRPGPYTFAVTIGDGLATVTATVPVTVPAVPTGLSVTPASASVRPGGGDPLAASVLDQFGLPVAAPVTWAVVSGGGTVDAAGLFTAAATPGDVTVRATALGLSADAVIHVTAVVDAPVFTTAPTASPAAVAGTTATLAAVASDATGSVLTYAWGVVSAPAAAAPSFASAGAPTTVVTFDAAGDYTFAVTVTGPLGSLTGTVAVTVAATPTHLSVTPAAATVAAGGTRPLAATLVDQFGGTLSAPSAVTWSVTGDGTVDPATGLYTAGPAAGQATVTATAAGLTGTAAVTVTDGPGTATGPTFVEAAAATPTSATAVVLTATGDDPAGESALTYTWAAVAAPAGAAPTFGPTNGTNAGKAAAVAVDAAGTYVFAVTASDGPRSAVSLVTLAVAAVPTGLVVTPAAATADTESPTRVAAVAVDQFGHALPVQPPVAWSTDQGAIDAAGLLRGNGAVGPATVRATAAGLVGTAVVTLVEPDVGLVAPAYADPVVGPATAVALHALTRSPDPVTYTWSVVSGPAAATFPATNGTAAGGDLSAALVAAGTYTFRVTAADAADPTDAATGDVTVTVAAVAVTVTASVPSSLVDGQSATATAVATDQFGRPVAAAVTWSATGAASITAAGGLTTTAPGQAVVTATAGAASAAATVTVIAATPSVAVPAYAVFPSDTAATAALHVRGLDGVGAGDDRLTYTWSIVTQPAVKTRGKHKPSAAPPAPLAVFGANGTRQARDTAVTFLAAGTYTLRASATDGATTVTSDVTVTARRAAAAAAATAAVPTGVRAVTDGTSVTGFVVTFSRPLDAASAQSPQGYAVKLATAGRTVKAALLRAAPAAAKRTVKTPPPRVASAVYDPATGTVTLTLATPVPAATEQFTVGVAGGGPHAVRDAAGRPVDGDANGRPGGPGRFVVRTAVGQAFARQLPGGGTLTMALDGPGSLLVAVSGNDPSPDVWVVGGDDTSMLTGNAVGRAAAAAVPVTVTTPDGAAVNFGQGLYRLG